jgi:AcrR family transcriptional regulator
MNAPVDPSMDIDAKTRLIFAGERLFASGGINGVSMREIAAAARQKNHAAVQYHFGSREGLIQAIFDYRMDEMEPTRGVMLAALERKGLTKDAQSILEVILLPQLQINGGDNAAYGNFLSQFLLRQQWFEFGNFGHEAPPNLAKAFQLLGQRVDYLPPAVAQRRLVNVSLMFLNLLVRQERPASEAPESFDVALADTMDQIVAAMCLPLRQNLNERLQQATSKVTGNASDV